MSWKQFLRDTLKSMISDMFMLFCFISVLFIAVNFQTAEQLQALNMLIVTRNWTVLFIMLLGVIVVSSLVEKIVLFVGAFIFIVIFGKK